MPDGSQQPVDPDAQRAGEQMRDWREQQRQGDGGGGFWDTIGNSIGDMMAAAEAGAFAVSPDTGAAIIKQLSDVQAQVSDMLATGGFGAMSQQLGGGYAKDIATFNRQVTEDGIAQTLAQFSVELDQLKQAVQTSIAHYGATDSAASQSVNQSGGGL
jgi:hypothetical protein